MKELFLDQLASPYGEDFCAQAETSRIRNISSAGCTGTALFKPLTTTLLKLFVWPVFSASPPRGASQVGKGGFRVSQAVNRV